MKNKKTKLTILCVSIIAVITICTTIIYTNYNKRLESEKEELSEGIAIYVSDGEGNYIKSYSSTFTGYTINETKSVCYNSNGDVLTGVIDVDSSTGALIITTTVKLYCDIYLDEK